MGNPMSLSELRREYMREGLREGDLDADPLRQFRSWLDQALETHPQWFEVNAMTLATATADAAPSARMVLLKEIDDRGFIFYTNYKSRKGHELAANPRAAAALFWPMLERQVRVVGAVEKVSRERAETYFHRRPRPSQLGALASHQSEPGVDRRELERRMASLEAQHEGREIPMPDAWGGYRIVPQEIEFWQGGAGRLHDRLRYRRESEEQDWQVERLSP